ncbi:ABC transporter ATP-binding protein [Apilactobacillus xinyiensis]|uniref:ABC transporter ATP-binding protein n=1 Tax=Apilactobacillus xinyiensis TaxID=2841032 RepID=UPI00200C916F|nr:ABC-F family ATP-binding cassette domain-containing protein [Apilactobacillus xinyiensis]MCL0319061.1 ABC-F family ATP-binding cassette domain-containing protein [Apilactobacillus xinyiensis]
MNIINILQIKNVTKRFLGKDIFTKVNLNIQENSKIALVGRNGVGKSTLVKMIMGLQDIDEGQIIKNKNLSIGYLQQNSGLNSDKTILEEMESVFEKLKKDEKQIHNLETKIADPKVINNEKEFERITNLYSKLQAEFERNNGFGYKAEIRSVLHGFGFDEKSYNKKINKLSGGQQTQLAMAKLLLEKNDLLILDEPTNHIDVKTINWLENYLRGYDGALMIISHDRYFMDKVVNEVYEMCNGSIEYYNGNYSYFTKEKVVRLHQKAKQFEKQQKEIQSMQDFVNKNIVRASTTKRAQSRRKQLQRMDKIEKPISSEKSARFSFSINRQSGNNVLSISDLEVGYNETPLLKHINLDIKRHQRIAIIGPNGSGKSTILKTIIGQIPKLNGVINFGTGVSIGYYDQHQKLLHNDKDVLHELWDDYPTTPENKIRTILGSFLFSGEDVEKNVKELSGGEKARLLLTKLSMHHDNFLILDEPTNHLDIDSREVLERALEFFEGTILFISHDRYFINKMTTSILEVADHHSKIYLGNYDYYLDKKDEEKAALESQHEAIQEPIKEETSSSKKAYFVDKETQKKLRKLKRNVQEIERQLSLLAKSKKELQIAMTNPDNINNIDKLNDLQNKVEDIDNNVNSLEEQWENDLLEIEGIEKAE